MQHIYLALIMFLHTAVSVTLAEPVSPFQTRHRMSCPTASFGYTVSSASSVVLSNTATTSAAVIIPVGNYMTVGQLVSNVSTTNLRFINVVQSNGNVIFEGSLVPKDRAPLDFSSAYFNRIYGPYTLVDPTVIGTLRETFTPYIDLNGNQQFDAATECLGTPTVLNYRIVPAINFGFSATGSTVVNLSNAGAQATTTVTGCAGGWIAMGKLTSNVPINNLRFIEKTTSNGNVVFMSYPVPQNRAAQELDITYFNRVYGQYTLLDPTVTGTLSETFTPYIDYNNNRQFDPDTEYLDQAVVLNYKISTNVRQATIQNGGWSTASVWSCGKAPSSLDNVLIRHTIRIPEQYQGQVKQISYEPGGSLFYTPSSQLKVYSLP